MKNRPGTALVVVLATQLACSGGDSDSHADAATDLDANGANADANGANADANGANADANGANADASGGDIDAANPDQPFWAITHIDYTGDGVDESADFDTCYFCDANDTGTHTLLRYQQGDGYTIWALYIPAGATVGAHTLTQDYNGYYATLSANDTTLPDSAQGFYFGDVNVGTVTFTSLESGTGGSIAGSIDVSWTKGGVTAHLTSTFHAESP